ncbi:acyl-CoA synthetase [Gordonia spumicola]|uniref:Acyl-CoA synthetase n=1 Tax=Gordonia spumicola TaxID=589161 RepID=A0A7I9V5B2_9ACTN|nr:AMP-binding protein [Gordonia spumicola]GEE00599.1 acyl-CoA synthetase [Gordonia spumicola]
MSLPTLTENLAARAADRTEAIALTDPDETVDYGTLWTRAHRVAGALTSAGVTDGDRIAHLAPDSRHFYELLYGAALIGAVVVPISPRLSADEARYIVTHSGSRLAVTDRADILEGPIEIVQANRFAQWRDAADATSARLAEVDADTAVVQLYTSGTTGLPKGVVLAHRSFSAIRALLDRSGLDWIDFRTDDVSLTCMSVSHIGGLWWATQGLSAGVNIIVLPTFAPEAARRAIADRRVTITCVAPAMLMQLLEDDPELGEYATLRKVVYGGSPIGANLLTRAMDVTGADLVQIYGLTETGNTAVCLPPAAHRLADPPLHAAGHPYPGVGLSIRNACGDEVPTGATGEVFLRSPARMLGYFHNPEATTKTLSADGWVATGDAGYINDDGLLVIHDRVKDLIIVGGENVYPAEVEKAIGAHPDIRDCAVIGVPDDRWGESVHAFMVPRPGSDVTVGAVARSLRGSLAAYKAPASYEFVNEIPRNPAGKPLRRSLREPFWSAFHRSVN